MFGEIYSKCITFSYKLVYLQLHVNKVHIGQYIYQFHLCISSLNLIMNTFPEYTRYFKFDFE